MSKKRELIILHDLDGRPYYKALESLDFSRVRFVESSIFRILARDFLKNKNIFFSIRRFFKNLLFRLSVPFIKNKVIVMGMAPNDFRVVYYSFLKKKNKLIIHTSHPYWNDSERSIRKYGSYLDKFFRAIWIKTLNDSNISVVCVTKASLNSLLLFSGSTRIYQIYHAVDESIYYPNRNKKQNDVLHIAFIGNFVFSKGLVIIKYLVESLADDDRFKFHIIGDGENKSFLSETLLYKNVTYYGQVYDDRKKSEVLRYCDVLINPSIKTKKWQELLGIVNIEGMMSGLAVIASKHIGPEEIINSDVGILVDDSEENVFLNKIKFLQENPEALYSYQKNAVKESQRFSFECISKKWKDIIDE
ncbi:glycosyltransferase [Marinomonas sp. RSW2]|uniref:Glycosyltransferase n=1 Tax=Marinomonas maritima TaxID=2940935 RepID=A0ABT5WDC5_9GAMM|nr:glycosyltransferase [Marinomonas maritima]MDE8601621.1 glycosyltransferase [Marinomonas maritima]